MTAPTAAVPGPADEPADARGDGPAGAPAGSVPAPSAAEQSQRPPAEVRYAAELAALRAADTDPRPPGWQLSLRAARR
ncbi:MAG: hypothetical protein FWE75_23730, partial [Actinomycetia bacterium]|nr:hypothetical protein [Actinomycetes bacterium]